MRNPCNEQVTDARPVTPAGVPRTSLSSGQDLNEKALSRPSVVAQWMIQLYSIAGIKMEAGNCQVSQDRCELHVSRGNGTLMAAAVQEPVTHHKA